MANNLVIGIDPASVRLAFYGIHPTLPTVIPYKVILGKKSSPQTLGAAFDASLEAIDKMTMMSRTAQRFAFIEAPVVGRGGANSTIVQSMTSGVVQACLVKAGFEVYVIHQSTWKSWLGVSPSGKKPEVSRAMQARFPKDWHACGQDEDLLDAAALGRYGCEAVRRSALVAPVRGVSKSRR